MLHGSIPFAIFCVGVARASLGISGDGTWVTFPSLPDNLVAGDTNGVLDVFVHAPVTARFVGIPAFRQPVHFEVENANVAQVGHGAIVLLSCSGTSGFALPDGRIVHLVLDVCTSAGLSVLWALSGTIDLTGTAATPSFYFPDLLPGFTIDAAALTVDLATSAIVSITDPTSLVTQ